MFLACSARSSNLRLLPELFAVPFIASTMKSPEKRVSLLTASKMERKIAKRSCYWTGNGAERGRKKEPKKWGKKLIAAFCSAINDDEGLEGRETFRWLREDVLRCPLSPPSSHLIHSSPRQSAPLIPNFFAKLSVTLDNNNSNEGDDDDDDRPANGIKGKNILGAPRKRLRCLYTLQSAPFGRLLALES